MAERTRIVAKAVSASLEAKKSIFYCDLKTVSSEEEARGFIQECKSRYKEARHNCYAWRLGDSKLCQERFSDDGEPSGTAGKPILEVLKGAEVYDVVAVVSRIFGGTLLGTGGLVRAYTGAVQEALAASDVEELKPGCRVTVSCDYSTANRLKYLTDTMNLYTESETYTDICTFVYLLPDEVTADFIKKIQEFSSGSAGVEISARVLYYGLEKPEVYRLLSTGET